MPTQLTLGGGTTTTQTSPEDAYVISNADGETIGRPIQGLPAYDRANTRPFGEGVIKEVAQWFCKYTGLIERHGKTYVNSLNGFAWVQTLKGFFPARGSSLLSYVWEEGEDGKKAPVGKPLGYRMWNVVPTFDLSDPANVAAFNEGASFSMAIKPTISAIGKKLSQIKATSKYDVPRLVYRNFVLVDHTVEADGTIIPTRVLANYLLRLQFKNKNIRVARRDGEGDTMATVFADSTQRKATDVTDEFLAVYNQIEGKDCNDRVYKTLCNFWNNPQLAETKLAKIMQLQGRSLAGAHVASIPGSPEKKEQDLIDRFCMYSVKVRDCYYGVERTIEGKAPEDEFTDFHCRLMSIHDPLIQDAQGLAGVARLNDGVNLVMSE